MKLTIGMLVKNEADRFLDRVIRNINQFADEIVVLDDKSTDHTIEIIKENSKIPVFINNLESGNFGNEIVLRKELYRLVLERNPDWYMIIDADEFYTNATRSNFEQLMESRVNAWAFRLYDMWSETHYRDDHLWKAHHFFSVMLVRNVRDFTPEWRETPHHCGRIPMNIWDLGVKNCETIKIKHFGWATEEIRKHKFDRYIKYDGDGKYGSLEQYHSILDSNPNLIQWED